MEKNMNYESPQIKEIELEADGCIMSASTDPFSYGQNYGNDLFD